MSSLSKGLPWGFTNALGQPHIQTGANFIAFAQGEAVPSNAWNIIHNANTSNLANTATSICFVVKDNDFVSIDGALNFAILA